LLLFPDQRHVSVTESYSTGASGCAAAAADNAGAVAAGGAWRAAVASRVKRRANRPHDRTPPRKKACWLGTQSKSHSTANPCSFAQKGALAALKGDQQPITDMRDEFDMRRNYMFDRISKIPNVTAVKPQGAFYVLVNISQLGLTSQNFADRLLSKANVAVVPGAAFGDDRTVRLSYATSIDIIKKGLDRFQDFCRTL